MMGENYFDMLESHYLMSIKEKATPEMMKVDLEAYAL